ncbi:MAG: hypothetical protein AB7N90_02975 [Vicinamibacterales bacterium]
MRFVNRTLGFAAAAIIACAAPAGAQAPRNDKTILTFDAPVQVPGATLPAGTYVFRQADATSGREVVQVLDKDTRKIYTTTYAIPATRLDTDGNIVVKFASTPPGMAPAIKSWFAAGTQIGHHFLYPADQARDIAKTTKTLVQSADSDESDMASLRLAPLVNYDVSGAKFAYDTRRLDYDTLRAPAVRASADDRAEGSGTVHRADMTPEERAASHLSDIVALADTALAAPMTESSDFAEASDGTVAMTRAELKEIRTHA